MDNVPIIETDLSLTRISWYRRGDFRHLSRYMWCALSLSLECLVHSRATCRGNNTYGLRSIGKLSTLRLQVDDVGSIHRRVMLWIPCCVALADFQLHSAYLSAVRSWFSFYFGAEREIRARQIKYGTGSAHLGGNVALNRDENMDL